jgi:hypothetical protein
MSDLDDQSKLALAMEALLDIKNHWANEYDHPRKQTEMYRGSYGIGVTDGHRACTIIAERALEKIGAAKAGET